MGPAPGGTSPARGLPARLSAAPLVVLDTDVVVTALIGSRNASSYRLCRAVGAGDVMRLAISDRFLTELVGIVRERSAEGLILDPARAFEVVLDFGFHGEYHRPDPLPWPSVSDPLDWWALDLAYASEADFVIVWDRHLLDADLPIPVEVITPPEMLRRLRAERPYGKDGDDV